MKSIALIVTATLATMTLSGCAGHYHRLVSEGDTGRVVGSLRHEGNEAPSMVLEYDGKRYEGRGFKIHRDQNLAELQRRYGYGSKHYERISSSLDTDHLVYSAETDLSTNDGTSMRCSLAWVATKKPAGLCTTFAGKQIKILAEN
jgi:hypothetical protein